MMTHSIVLGIDGGGTTTRVMAADLGGHVVGLRAGRQDWTEIRKPFTMYSQPSYRYWANVIVPQKK